MTNLATLRLDVAKNQNSHTSAVMFINGIAAEIKASCEVPAGTKRPLDTIHTEYDRNNPAGDRGDNRGTGYDGATLATDRSRSSVGIAEQPASTRAAYREGYINSARTIALADWLNANADGLAFDILNKAGAPRP